MREYHIAAAFGTLLVAAALTGGSLAGSFFGSTAVASTNLADMEAIEASLAYKKTTKSKQPQKQFRAPVPEEKPEGVSRDENKPVEPAKPDEPKPKPDEDFEKLYDKFKRDDADEDVPVGKPTEDEGSEDGSEKGNADVSKGDPYFQQLLADMDWSYPQILKGSGIPVGCMKLNPDGTIARVWLASKTGSEELNDAAERALQKIMKLRNENPQPVPSHLLRATAEKTCFSFTL
jgi:outer membrane biosynthesis protein TonB